MSRPVEDEPASIFRYELLIGEGTMKARVPDFFYSFHNNPAVFILLNFNLYIGVRKNIAM